MRSSHERRLVRGQTQDLWGDDGVEFIDAAQLEAMIVAAPNATPCITFDQDSMELFIIEWSVTSRLAAGSSTSISVRSPPSSWRDDDARFHKENLT